MATGGAIIVGVVSSSICLLGSLFVAGPDSGLLVALGVILPGLLLQDSWRWAFFARGRNDLATWNDVLWALLLLAVLTIALFTEYNSVAMLLGGWGAAGSVAGLFGMVQAKTVPHPFRALVWWRGHGDLGIRYLGEFVALSGATQGSTYAVGAVAGIVEVGVLRAGMLLLGPFQMLLFAASTIAVPEGVRFLRRSASDLRRASLILSLALATAALIWGSIALAIPEEVGVRLLGANWGPSRRVLVPLLLYYLAWAMLAGPALGLRAMAAAKVALRVRVFTASLVLCGAIVGAALGQGRGAAWGMAAANLISVVAWWLQYYAALRNHDMGATSTASFGPH